MNKIHLVSYATRKFKRSQIRLIESANRYHLDTNKYNFSKENIKKFDFYKQNLKIFRSSRGDGYWLWKPFLIQLALKSTNLGDVIVYADSGLEIIKPLDPLLKLLNNTDILLFSNGCGYLNKQYTKSVKRPFS